MKTRYMNDGICPLCKNSDCVKRTTTSFLSQHYCDMCGGLFESVNADNNPGEFLEQYIPVAKERYYLNPNTKQEEKSEPIRIF